MLSASQCQKRAGLSSHEVVLGVSPSEKHEKILESYKLNLRRGERFVFDMILADLRGFVDLGALDYAADIFIVLRRFLDERPHLRCMTTLPAGQVGADVSEWWARGELVRRTRTRRPIANARDWRAVNQDFESR